MRKDRKRTAPAQKPEWYARVGEGPFGRQEPAPEVLQAIEKHIAAGQPVRGKRLFTLKAAASGLALLIAVVVTILALRAEPSRTIPASQEKAEPNERTPGEVIAFGESDYGRLVVSLDPSVPAARKLLGAASCYGTDTDVRTEGGFQVSYETASSRAVVASFPKETFIQPTEKPFPMLKLSFPEADVFLLVPQYRDCHGLSFYAFAVDKGTNTAFPLSFVTADGTTSEQSYYAPNADPAVRGSRLVLSTAEGPGGETGEGAQERIFRLDLASQTFIQEP